MILLFETFKDMEKTFFQNIQEINKEKSDKNNNNKIRLKAGSTHKKTQF